MNIKLSINALLPLAAFFLSVVVINNSSNIQEEWQKKTLAQRNVNYQLNDADSKWRSLSEIRNLWNELYLSEEDTDGSLYNLMKVLDIESTNLKPTKKQIIDSKLTNVTSGKISIGLSKMCIKNTNNSFQVTAKNITQLTNGLKMLSERSEIDFNDFRIINKVGEPLADIYDLCMLMRI